MIQFDQSFHPMVLYENHLICIFMKINENFNQRTNVPVNAHLISEPIIITKTSFATFEIAVKIGQGQLGHDLYKLCRA